MRKKKHQPIAFYEITKKKKQIKKIENKKLEFECERAKQMVNQNVVFL